MEAHGYGTVAAGSSWLIYLFGNHNRTSNKPFSTLADKYGYSGDPKGAKGPAGQGHLGRKVVQMVYRPTEKISFGSNLAIKRLNYTIT